METVKKQTVSMHEAGVSKFLTDEPRWSSASLCVRFFWNMENDIDHIGNEIDVNEKENDDKRRYNYFRPEYTHQCTETESFIGYRPLRSVLTEARKKFFLLQQQKQQKRARNENGQQYEYKNDMILHKSHQENDDTKRIELDIQIQLAPSCRKCQLLIQTHDTRTEEEEQTMKDNETTITKSDDNDVMANTTDDTTAKDDMRPTKKQKLSFSSEVIMNETTAETGKDRVQSLDDIKMCIMKGLPQIVDDGSCNDDYLDHPVGQIIQQYSWKDPKNNHNDNNYSTSHEFCLSIADGSSVEVQRYHNQVQKLALWFIENADDINVSSNDDCQSNGYWKILYLWRKKRRQRRQKKDKDDEETNSEKEDDNDKATNEDESCEQYSLVGYMTLFHFIAPFHKPKPGIIVRICQALVLPPYQGQGHGTAMMNCVYEKLVHTNVTEQSQPQSQPQPIVQINVEDPAPGFVALRNKIDLYWLTERHPEWWPTATTKTGTMSTSFLEKEYDEKSAANFFMALSETELVEMSGICKLTTRQITIINELYKLKILLQSRYFSVNNTNKGEGGNDTNMQRNENDNDDEYDDIKTRLETKFRLMVKKRLNKEHREDMYEYPTKDEKKAYLAKLFDEEYTVYKKLLSSSSSSTKHLLKST